MITRMKKSTMSLLAALLLAGGTATGNVQLQKEGITVKRQNIEFTGQESLRSQQPQMLRMQSETPAVKESATSGDRTKAPRRALSKKIHACLSSAMENKVLRTMAPLMGSVKSICGTKVNIPKAAANAARYESIAKAMQTKKNDRLASRSTEMTATAISENAPRLSSSVSAQVRKAPARAAKATEADREYRDEIAGYYYGMRAYNLAGNNYGSKVSDIAVLAGDSINELVINGIFGFNGIKAYVNATDSTITIPAQTLDHTTSDGENIKLYTTDSELNDKEAVVLSYTAMTITYFGDEGEVKMNLTGPVFHSDSDDIICFSTSSHWENKSAYGFYSIPAIQDYYSALNDIYGERVGGFFTYDETEWEDGGTATIQEGWIAPHFYADGITEPYEVEFKVNREKKLVLLMNPYGPGTPYEEANDLRDPTGYIVLDLSGKIPFVRSLTPSGFGNANIAGGELYMTSLESYQHYALGMSDDDIDQYSADRNLHSSRYEGNIVTIERGTFNLAGQMLTEGLYFIMEDGSFPPMTTIITLPDGIFDEKASEEDREFRDSMLGHRAMQFYNPVSDARCVDFLEFDVIAGEKENEVIMNDFYSSGIKLKGYVSAADSTIAIPSQTFEGMVTTVYEEVPNEDIKLKILSLTDNTEAECIKLRYTEGTLSYNLGEDSDVTYSGPMFAPTDLSLELMITTDTAFANGVAFGYFIVPALKTVEASVPDAFIGIDGFFTYDPSEWTDAGTATLYEGWLSPLFDTDEEINYPVNCKVNREKKLVLLENPYGPQSIYADYNYRQSDAGYIVLDLSGPIPFIRPLTDAAFENGDITITESFYPMNNESFWHYRYGRSDQEIIDILEGRGNNVSKYEGNTVTLYNCIFGTEGSTINPVLSWINNYTPVEMTTRIVLPDNIFGNYVEPERPLYATGDASNLENQWDPANPYSFLMNEEGNYVGDLREVSNIVISTEMGDWDTFNTGRYYCDYGDEPGVTVPLELNPNGNIIMPWQGNWHVEVAGDLTWIRLTTSTPKPSDNIPVYLRGGMTNWDAVAEWQMSSEDGKTYTFTCAPNQYIPAGTEFKFADAQWAKINYGVANYGTVLGMGESVLNYDGDNIILDQDWYGSVTLYVDKEAQWASCVFVQGENPPTPPADCELAGHHAWSHISMLDENLANGYVTTSFYVEPDTLDSTELNIYGLYNDFPVKASYDAEAGILTVKSQQLNDSYRLDIAIFSEDGQNLYVVDEVQFRKDPKGNRNWWRADFDYVMVVSDNSDRAVSAEYGNLFCPFGDYTRNMRVSEVFTYNESEWKDAGTAVIKEEGWYSGQDLPVQEYEVPLATSENYPGMVLLLNPYGADTPFNLGEGFMMLDLNHSFPMLRPFVCSGAMFKSFNTTFESYHYYIGGSDEEWIAGFMRELGKEPSTIDEANLVTLNDCWIAPVWDYFGMYGFGDASQKTLIQLPANLTGIGSVESGKNEPARYFNLQGIEVTRPAAGEVVVEKRGDATRKVIVR